MITASNIALAYGKRIIFQDVNIKFTPGNCYGLIGANGAGKSTFLKILAKQLDPDRGEIFKGPGQRIAMLSQDQFAFDEHTVFNTVVMGHKKLYKIMSAREALYAKADFTEEDGILSGELEVKFGEMNGYEAEAEASTFGNPDILLLDEPTNQLDLRTINWLEGFLARFNNTVIIVSHDRHFLNQVCTHVADIDYGKISIYVGNYDFWYEASQLHFRQKETESKKVKAKAEELKEFIRRFSSNASKAKQATSRKKLLEKLTIDQMPASSRKYPYIVFKPERACGDIILEIDGLSKEIEGVSMFKDLSLTVNKGDKIAFIGPNSLAKTTLFQILAGELEPDEGSFRWGVTISNAYFPKENNSYFDNDQLDLIGWLRQFAPPKTDESFIRGFLGKMLFSGEEATKKTSVLSGGERVRCMLSKMMLANSNVLILDEPTNHLDLESITSLNNGLMAFSEVVLFASHDHQFMSTVANRIVEITPDGIVDMMMTFDQYLEMKEANLSEENNYLGQKAA
jgi:ATPase subunit of ABC transporter with duplicated ATPase domains